VFFFFSSRRRHTRSYGDWSSDVCSSDLCEIAVPPGMLTVEARKGPEYWPLRATVDLPAGKLALRFAVERWTDLRADGWYSGDAQIGRASCRERVEVWVVGGARNKKIYGK